MSTATLNRSLLNELNLFDSDGVDYVDRASSALSRLDAALKRLRESLAPQQRLRTTTQGYKSWRDSLQNFTPSEQQLDKARRNRSSTLNVLGQFEADANAIVQILQDSNVDNATILHHIQTLDKHILSLVNFFPYVRSSHMRPKGTFNTSGHSQQQNRTDWDNYDFSRTASEPGLAQAPPGQPAQAGPAAGYEAPGPGFLSHGSPPRNFIKRVATDKSALAQAGYHYATPADAAAQTSAPGLTVDEFIVSDTAAGIAGNVYGEHPFVRMQMQQLEFQLKQTQLALQQAQQQLAQQQQARQYRPGPPPGPPPSAR